MLLLLTNRDSVSLEFETTPASFLRDLNRTLIAYRQRDELGKAPELLIAVSVPGGKRIVWVSPNYLESKNPLILDQETLHEIMRTRGTQLWNKIQNAYRESESFQEWFQDLIHSPSETDEHGKPHLEVVRPGDADRDDTN